MDDKAEVEPKTAVNKYHHFNQNIRLLPLVSIVMQKQALLWTLIVNNSILWATLTLHLCSPMSAHTLNVNIYILHYIVYT